MMIPAPSFMLIVRILDRVPLIHKMVARKRAKDRQVRIQIIIIIIIIIIIEQVERCFHFRRQPPHFCASVKLQFWTFSSKVTDNP